MRNSGRIAAAIEILTEIEAQRRPAKLALREWGSVHRFAGSKDRAWISGLVLDVLRKRRSLGWAMEDETPRALVFGALRLGWGWEDARIADAAAEAPHGPGALTGEEISALAAPRPLEDAPAPIAGDYPDWLAPSFERVFGEKARLEGAALSERAGVDLRVNTLKAAPDKALAALSSIKPQASAFLTNALRLPAPAPEARGDHVESIPAYAKGWVEIQDMGSQIAACAGGRVKGAQILDLCAGGGGKTLALAALMDNTGQIFAYDSDQRRLAPIFERSKRAGVRNLQVRSPSDANPLHDLLGKMDLVFVDAPCTGSGVWRRQPDAKWRLRPGQLTRRIEEQDEVLVSAADFVRPGGRLVYVTCSVFAEENEDRLAAFGETHRGWTVRSAARDIIASGAVSAAGEDALTARERDGCVRLTPGATSTDGFFISVLEQSR